MLYDPMNTNWALQISNIRSSGLRNRARSISIVYFPSSCW